MGENLYGVLGVDKNASPTEISKAYKTMARTHHPDKGGSEDAFKRIQRAYDVLSDDKSKEFYDMTGAIPGEDGAPQGGGGMPGGMPFNMGGGMPFGMNMADLFGMFGQRQGGGGGPRRKRQGKAPPRIERLPLSLQQLYRGFSMQVGLNRDKFCVSCKGIGSKIISTCDKCSGSGTTTQHVMIGPGMMMQTNGPCGACHGQGEQKGPPCNECNGKCLTRQSKTLDIRIAPGTMPGETITFEGEASDTLDFELGSDLQFVIDTADDENGWVRDNTNLRNQVNISLKESLCGCHVRLMGHPAVESGVPIYVEIPRGTLNGAEITVQGRGMPRKGSSLGGNMCLKVNVSVQEAEARVLVEQSESIAAIFGYRRETPTGENLWIGGFTGATRG